MNYYKSIKAPMASILLLASSVAVAMEGGSGSSLPLFPQPFAQPCLQPFAPQAPIVPEKIHRSTFKSEHAKNIQMPSGIGPVWPSSLAQWLLWEQKANINNSFDDPRRPIETVDIKILSIDTGTLGPVWINQSSLAPSNLINVFVAGNESTVWWPQHPDNTQAQVPFFHHHGENDKIWHMRYTSSRTVTIVSGRNALQPLRFGIKLPTNKLSPTYQIQADSKAHFAAEALLSPQRWDMIAKIDALIGEPENLKILAEPFSIFVPYGAGNQCGGFLVRDLSLLDEEHYYLPAFSIGREPGIFIASKFTKENNLGSWVSFWAEYYVKPMGALSAKLLYRYGLTQINPHEQQFLIQLNRVTLEPTGTIVLRDLVDTTYTKKIFKYLGLESFFERDKKVFTEFQPNLGPRMPLPARVNGHGTSPFCALLNQIAAYLDRQTMSTKEDGYPDKKSEDDRLISDIGHKFWEVFVASYLTELKNGLPGIEDYFPVELKMDPANFKFSDYETDPKDLKYLGDESSIQNIEEMISSIIYHPEVVKLWKERRYLNLDEAHDQIRRLGVEKH